MILFRVVLGVAFIGCGVAGAYELAAGTGRDWIWSLLTLAAGIAGFLLLVPRNIKPPPPP